MEPFEEDISGMNSLKDTLVADGGHPPVIELCDNVNQRFNWLKVSVEARCDSTDKCSKVVTEFDDGEGCPTSLTYVHMYVCTYVCT